MVTRGASMVAELMAGQVSEQVDARTTAFWFVLTSLVPFVIFGIGLLLVRTMTVGGRVRLPVDVGGRVLVHAFLARPDTPLTLTDRTSSANQGLLVLSSRDLEWRPELGEGWRVPASSIEVTAVHGRLAATATPSVDVEIAGRGPLRLEVSDRRIDRLLAKNVGTAREAGMARQFATALVASGARDGR